MNMVNPIPFVSPCVLSEKVSGRISSEVDQPLGTSKENEGLNSPELYSPGRRACPSSAGRGRGLASSSCCADPLPQPDSASIIIDTPTPKKANLIIAGLCIPCSYPRC